MTDFEKAGSFYLGKTYDVEKGEIRDDPVLYDARDLTTHAVCLGMTGSGKTGLCIDLLEEAALDGVPSIIVDPKGDITNLLLTFPDLRPEDFQPWVNVDDARRKDMTVEEYAVKIARTWAGGLAQWGQGPDRIRRLRDAAEFTIFTPGSDAGQPVSILQTLKSPALSWDDNEEALRQRISGTVSALLGLVGVEADPMRSREHILLANLFEAAWRQGQDLDIAQLIMQIQKPPIRKLGVFDVDTFFPEKDRFELAMAFNAIIAAPGFQSWIEGVPLDIESILHAPDGRPRASIFYVAHLSDAERMFFVSLLLEQVQTWMRAQSGTTSLRCIVYFDEIFGYFPPHPANPPSKQPLLTLLKQARAFGVGLVLVTQNPLDLDYKGLTNAGTWFVGKLQTDRDKARVLEALEGVAAGRMDRRTLDRLISSLDSRVFLLHDVHEDEPVVFNTRWAMSYLRGPLTKLQVKELMSGAKIEAPAPPMVPVRAAAPAAAPAPAPAAAPSALPIHPPSLPSSIAQYFLPVRTSFEQAVRALESERGGSLAVTGKQLVYEPHVLGLATVRLRDRKSGVDTLESVVRLVAPPERGAIFRWDEGAAPELTVDDVATEPFTEAAYADVPEMLNESKELTTLKKDFVDYVYYNVSVSVWHNPTLKVYSAVGDSERDFRRKCEEAAREKRDAERKKVEKQYARKLKSLEDKLAREKRELAEDEAEYEARKREELLSAGESVLGMLTGRRASRAISTASRKRRMTTQAKADVEESVEAIADYEKDMADLEAEMEEELEQVNERWAETLDDVEEVRITPTRSGISVDLFGLAWVPRWEIGYTEGGQERVEVVGAFGE